MIKGVRHCQVLTADDAEAFADWLGQDGWGLKARDMGVPDGMFQGAVFPSATDPESTWAEIWPEGEGMPIGTMLQIVVDDADRYANNARDNGIQVEGPMEMFGEWIFFAEAPSGVKVAVLSKAPV